MKLLGALVILALLVLAVWNVTRPHPSTWCTSQPVSLCATVNSPPPTIRRTHP